jgi:hypothetical protein
VIVSQEAAGYPSRQALGAFRLLFPLPRHNKTPPKPTLLVQGEFIDNSNLSAILASSLFGETVAAVDGFNRFAVLAESRLERDLAILPALAADGVKHRPGAKATTASAFTEGRLFLVAAVLAAHRGIGKTFVLIELLGRSRPNKLGAAIAASQSLILEVHLDFHLPQFKIPAVSHFSLFREETRSGKKTGNRGNYNRKITKRKREISGL